MAHVVLIPGFWLDGSAWDSVVPALQEAGHTVHPVTLPGLESKDADRSGITLQDHIDAVASLVDSLDGEVVLAGHSGGGAVAHAVVDARPGRITRVVYGDAMPRGDGECINDNLPVVDGEIPLPEWSEAFDEGSLRDLDDDLRAMFRERAIPTPARVAQDKQRLSGDEHRYDVPITLILCEISRDQAKEWIGAGDPGALAYFGEVLKTRDVTWVELPTSHWPMFTKPAELAEALVTAVGSAGERS